MNIREFYIVLKPRKSTQTYKMLVEVYHDSDQVIRYRISAGGKSFEMEKQLKNKREMWKLLKPPPFTSDNVEEAALALMDIQNAIDEKERNN